MQANIMVDVRQSLDEENGDALVSDLGRMPGVSAARMSYRTRRLVLVDYDPRLISSQQILGTALGRGFDARLVGM